MSSKKWSPVSELNKSEVIDFQGKNVKPNRKLSWQENYKKANGNEKVLLKNLGTFDNEKLTESNVENGKAIDHLSHASISDDEFVQISLKYITECNGHHQKGTNNDKSPPPPKRIHRRSKSLSRFELNDYTIGDIRKLHEKLTALPSKKFPTKSSFFKVFTTKQKLILCCLCMVEFTSYCSMSIMAPFFPKEAAQKGMSGLFAGFVFSFFALVVFVSSPFMGKIIPHTGPKFLYISGVFLTSTANFLFGLLGYISQDWVFAMYCFLTQGLKALGASAYFTAAFVFVAEIFPSNIGAVIGIMETFVGLGFSIGPVLGGFFYHVGGFGLPFYMLGTLLLLNVPIAMWQLPSSIQGSSVRKKTNSFLDMITQPTVIIISLVVVVTSNIDAFLDPTLEPHLRQFDLTPEKIGLIFLLFSAVYGFSSPIWGYVSDKTDNHWFMMTSGLLLSTLGFLLLGPAPFLPFIKSELWLNMFALVILGISIALSFLPTFEGLLIALVERGYKENDISTYSTVAGTWSSLFALGEVIGPLLGSIVTENYGFPVGCTIMAAVTFTLAIGSFIYFVVRDCLIDRGKDYRYNSEDSCGGDIGLGLTYSSDDLTRQPILPPGYHNRLYTEESDQRKLYY